ncbi:Arylesterase [Metallosphaera sp. J1]|uniref:alpha/beta hydrolase n=1 Tax=Metallosphaera javensis (ex Hofmann et al. 2022) TaxID=99938 RepID=UPI001EDEFBDA|nr:alpha/beta hydrolase [Metallosphaera javensis (ex Hofmann et al. 2022)]MCG3109460.1 Arylesterase [Metallosphaera javensis (ex Hofmann et al. 2022)]
MPLNPEVKKFLSLLPPQDLSRDVRELRRAWDSAFFATREKLEIVQDLEIPTRDSRIRARLYVPSNRENLPVLVYYHGGGFVFGSIESYDGLSSLIAKESGVAVLSVEYRLAPEHKFPTAVNDSWDALLWISENGSKLGLDTSRLAVAGDSAGGNLSAVMTLLDRDQGKRMIRYQVLIYPAVNMVDNSPSIHEFGEGYFLTRSMMSWFGSMYFSSGRDAVSPYASPALGNLHDLPPSLVITAEYDPLRDQGETYSHSLNEARNVSTLVRYQGMIHGFLSFYPWITAGRLAIHHIAGVLRSVL